MIAGNIAARVAFENCAPFTKSITKIDGSTLDDGWRLRFGYVNV